MFDAVAEMTPAGDRAAQIAREVAARYGVAVRPEAVQVLPVGVSSFVYPVWDGAHLVLPADHAATWHRKSKAAFSAHRTARGDAVVQARRAQLPGLLAEGLTDAQISDRLGVTMSVVAQDRHRLGLRCNPAPLAHVVASNTRLDIAMRLVAGGKGLDDIAATVGIKVDGLRRALIKRGVKLPRKNAVASTGVVGSKAHAARQLLRDGLSVAEVHAQTGVSYTRIRTLAKGLGLDVPARPVMPRSERRAAAEAVAARRARIAAGLAQGVPVLDLFKAETSANRAFHSDCMALGLAWPVPGLAEHLRGLWPSRGEGSVAQMVALRRADVARLIGQGMDRRGVAADLGISLKVLALDIRALGLDVPKVARRGMFLNRVAS